MQTIDIIQAEHRSMWRVATAMTAVAKKLDKQDKVSVIGDLRLVKLMLEYVNTYTDRFHHPKEDDYLFKKLRERSAAANGHIDKLQQEHEAGPHYLKQVDDAIDKAIGVMESGGSSHGVGAIQDSVLRFCEHLCDHIRLEETTILPLARKELTKEDWQEIDAVFARNDDPVFGPNAQEDMISLRSRIAQLAPDPIGFGSIEASANLHADVPHRSMGATNSVVMEVSGLTSHYGNIKALHGINLQIREGQLVALVGANGAGKTTLLRTISGVQAASGGAIRFGGTDITRMRADRRVRAGICQVPEGRRVFGPLSIEDNIRLGAFTRPKSEVESSLAKMFELFPVLKEKRALPAGTLSGGQQQMLAMARALMGSPKLLLLDEPSMGLAPLLVEEIFRIVKDLKSQGITILLVEQNAHAALSIADVGYVMETGNITLSGPGKELLQNEQVKAAYLGM